MARIRIETLERSEETLSSEDAAAVVGAGYYFGWGGPTVINPWGPAIAYPTVVTPYQIYPAIYPGVAYYGGYNPFYRPVAPGVIGYYGP